MLTKMENVFEKIGKYCFEHCFVTSGIELVLSVIVATLQITYYIRRNRCLSISK